MFKLIKSAVALLTISDCGLVAGDWVLAIDYWGMAIGNWALTINDWLPTIGDSVVEPYNSLLVVTTEL